MSQDNLKQFQESVAQRMRDASDAETTARLGLESGGQRYLLRLDEALEGEYAKARGLVWELDHPTEGRVRQMGSPLRLSDTPPAFRNFAPLLGEHTAPVMRELGYSDEDLKRLEAAGVIKTRTGG